MKRFLACWASIAVLVALSVLSVDGYAETLTWRLYDNFNKEIIDPDRWDIDASSATITIEGGRAKFEHEVGHPADSSFLAFKKGLKRIKGIRATVTVESCTGDVRGRVAGWIGKIGEDYVWDELSLQGGLDRIYGNSALIETVDYTTVYTLFWGHFMEPVGVNGNTFTITMVFSKKKLVYKVRGMGKIVVKLPEALPPTDDYFKGIGTRSTNGDGPCTVYFDDVYVLK